MNTTRRNFLKISSLATGGLALQASLLPEIWGQEVPEDIRFTPNFLLEIDEEGWVDFHYTRHEMGQGSFTGLSMIMADELGADWARFRPHQADFDLKYGEQIYGNTGGSGTVRRMWDTLRELAAKARWMLTQAAAETWQVPSKECRAEGGKVWHDPSQRSLDFGKLVAKASQLEVPKEAPQKTRDAFTLIGKELKNVNLDAIIEGSLDYSVNIQVPQMLYAAIVRAPSYGAQVKSWEPQAVLNMPGVVKVVEISARNTKDLTLHSPHIREGVAVLAQNTWQAFQAQKVLAKHIEWEEGKNAQENMSSIEKEMSSAWEKEGRVDFSTGKALSGLAQAHETLKATYTNPYQAHALMEPLCATASVKGNSCEVWASMQHPRQTLDRIAPVVGIPRENFRIHNLACGGSFGRRFYEDYVTEAVYLSKIMQVPVKVTWSREDEIRHDGFHEYEQVRHTVGWDENQNILGWETTEAFAQPSREVYVFPLNPYFVQHYHRKSVGMERRLMTMAWRSVHAHQSALGMECFIDELAHAWKKDPLELRLELLRNLEPAQDFHNEGAEGLHDFLMDVIRPRAIRVYEKIKELGIWKPDKTPGTGLGVAGFPFGPTFCAEVAEVEKRQGKIYIKKITCVVDCGIVVNPQLARGQIEGGVIWGLSALKYNRITIEQGRVQQSNFHDYPILRVDEVPEIEVHFLESDESPTGTGEPGVPPLAPAVLNAIFAATGKRYRAIPLKDEQVLV